MPVFRAAPLPRRHAFFTLFIAGGPVPHLLRWLTALAAVWVTLSLTTNASAASDSTAEDAQLEAQIQQGIALRRAGNDEGALALFLDLERSNPDSVRVLLHVTSAAEATGRWLMAYSYLHKVNNQKNDAYYIRYRAAIKGIEDATNQHIGQFRALGGPPGAEVRLNGEVLGTLPMSDAKPIEVGQYVLEVTRQGYYPLRRSVSVGPGPALTQEAVDLRPGASAAESALGPRANGLVVAGAAQRPERRPWWQARWITWTLGGATVASGATTAIALVYRNQRAERWNSSNCLRGTETRQQVCSGVRDDISLAQGIAIGGGIATAVFASATLTQAILSTEGPLVATGRMSRFTCSAGLGSVLCAGSF